MGVLVVAEHLFTDLVKLLALSQQIPQMLGRNTAQLRRFLGDEFAHPVVHRDNLVLV